MISTCLQVLTVVTAPSRRRLPIFVGAVCRIPAAFLPHSYRLLAPFVANAAHAWDVLFRRQEPLVATLQRTVSSLRIPAEALEMDFKL